MRWKAIQLCVLVACLSQSGFAVGQMTFTVSPENQPAVTEPSAKLKLYSDLNRKMAAGMDGPDSLCLKSYGDYQACKAADPAAKCGKAPKCSVTAVLTMAELSGIRFHFAPGMDAATLEPVGVNVAPPVPTTLAAPTKIPKDIQMVPQDAPPPPSSGVAGMGGMSSGTAGGVFGGISPGSGPIVVAVAPHPSGPVRISGGVLAGNTLSKVQPTYPPLAKVMHLGGVVVLHALITKQGTINSLQVASATNPVFEMSALNAVRQWTYKPYLLNGEPTDVDTMVTVNFNLNTPSTAPTQP